jgi:hypothetical protein
VRQIDEIIKLSTSPIRTTLPQFWYNGTVETLVGIKVPDTIVKLPSTACKGFRSVAICSTESTAMILQRTINGKIAVINFKQHDLLRREGWKMF